LFLAICLMMSPQSLGPIKWRNWQTCVAAVCFVLIARPQDKCLDTHPPMELRLGTSFLPFFHLVSPMFLFFFLPSCSSAAFAVDPVKCCNRKWLIVAMKTVLSSFRPPGHRFRTSFVVSRHIPLR